jgi:hypothetical protein
LSSPKPGIFSSATGLQDLVEDLDLPSHGIPFELLNGRPSRRYRQIGDQLPANLLSVPWCYGLLGVDYCQFQGRISLPLSDWWQNTDLAISDL